jgi:uncharacterized membrane protein
MGSGFSIEAALSFGWNAFKERIGFFIVLIIVSAVIVGIPYIFQGALQNNAPAIAALFGIIAYLVQLVIEMGWISIALKIVDGQDATLSNLMDGIPNVISFVIATIIYSIIVAIGLILLIVPGIYLAIRLAPVTFVIIDTGAGPIAALSRAWEITKGYTLSLFLFGLVAVVINIVGMLLFGIGLLVTAPVTALAYAYIYRRISGTQPVVSGEFSPQPQPGV